MFNELAITSQGIATFKNSDCNALCALAKANTGGLPTQSTQQNRNNRKSRRNRSSAEPCDHYVTVCTYKKMFGHREKVCNQVCKSNNSDTSGSSPAN